MKDREDRNPGRSELASSAAQRVEAIIEGAEKAAERVIDEAEASARAYLAEAEAAADRTVAERLAALGELTDALVAQAEAIRQQSEQLAASLREAKARLAGAGGAAAGDGAAGEEAAGSRPRLAAVVSPDERPVSDPGGGAEGGEPADEIGERRRRGTPAGARLLATQMAVSGSSREEIAARLRTGFEIEDTDAILDAILGPEAS